MQWRLARSTVRVYFALCAQGIALHTQRFGFDGTMFWFQVLSLHRHAWGQVGRPFVDAWLEELCFQTLVGTIFGIDINEFAEFVRLAQGERNLHFDVLSARKARYPSDPADVRIGGVNVVKGRMMQSQEEPTSV